MRTYTSGSRSKMPYRAATASCVLTAFTALVPAAWAQTTPAVQTPTQTPAASSSAASQTPKVDATVDEVSLNLVVHDKKHHLIQDLKPGDIVVTDNDAPVTLRDLHLVSGESKNGQVVTLVFDRFNGATAKSAQNVSLKVLRMLPHTGFSFAVVDLGVRLRLLQGFTSDRGAIEHAITVATDGEEANPGRASAAAEKSLISEAQTGEGDSGAHLSVNDRALVKTLVAAIVGSQQVVKDQHTTPTLAGLMALIRSQRDLSERKSIVYFTQNNPMDSAGKAMIQSLVGAAARAGVTFYTVDMNAFDTGTKHQLDNAILNGGAPYSPAQVDLGHGNLSPVPQQEAMPSGPTTTLGIATDWNRQSSSYTDIAKNPMAELATGTGGLYIDAQGNLKKPLESMVENMTTYYEATYIPPITEYDGSFRTIAVKPVRTGLNVHTRAGYFALPVSAGGAVRPFEVPLLKMLSQPQLPADLKFRSAIFRWGDLPDGNSNSLVIEKPVSELELRKDNHTHLYSAHVSIVAQIKDKDGTVIEHFGEDITRRGALEMVEEENSETITLQRHFIAPPGEYTLEAVMFDQYGNKAGAERTKFEIPGSTSEPSLSDMVLVRDVNAYREETDAQDPLRYDKSVVTPNVADIVSREAKNASIYFILHPDPRLPEPATLEMEVSRNGRPGQRTRLPMREGDAGAAIPYLATLSLHPGSYAVKAILSQGGKTSERDLTFTVEGTEPPAANEVASLGTHGPSETASDVDTKVLSTPNGEHSPNELTITVPANPIPPPAPEVVQTMIAEARKLANNYMDSLPNFICVEVTNRSTSSNGNGSWKHKDTIAELLRYHDKEEKRVMLGVDGKPSNGDRDSVNGVGTLSSGEFGGVLKAVFDDAVKADFKWKETNILNTGTVQVFDYSVAKQNSLFTVTGANGQQLIVGFHGQVFIDSGTESVRRITLIADGLPADFPTHATSIRVDYDYVSINSHDYLLPLSAEVSVQQHRREALLNRIEFRDYRRYGSNVQLHFDTDSKP